MTQLTISDVESEVQCKCDNCTWTGPGAGLDDIGDAQERLNAGGVVPAGQCPECGALAYLVNPPDWARQSVNAEMLAALLMVRIEMQSPGDPKDENGTWQVTLDNVNAATARAESAQS